MAVINFIDDLKEITVQKLSQLGYPEIPGEDLETLLLRYLNVRRRIPPVISWTIKKSQELINKPLSEEIRNGLQQFIIKAESGQNLKPHISTKINDPDYKDLMFYDWEIFHFHLGTEPHPTQPEFVDRTKELLFAIADIHSRIMYLIDIHPHKGGWTNQDLLRIIEENWEELLVRDTVRGINELDHNPSDNDIDSFRKAGLVTLVQTPGDRVLSPMGSGMTTDGTSFQNIMEADSIRRSVREIEDWFIQQREKWTIHFQNKYGKDWNDLQFKLKSFEEPVEIEELTTGEFLVYSSLN
ncbi:MULTISPECIES: hypothetical protein [unclassified Nodularia (in: cyanobacteria)]|uniref:hypothetical protein n=1 Tax=unclassified Nodularia (in: cyanobacteria) TaxID=2656917 RepID=UPI00187EDF64|nr:MULTISPECIES: hypothetical protein [unclassified Nodularia (in: cyanobacteria)]MBE9200200.1 hypothetical protein [Nodularia sp. LEGE 06071]MCC2694241.1 hypothetical protein [Nodularia sp. LEGE 04288]